LKAPALYKAMNIDPVPEYLTIEEAAAYLSMRPAQVRKLLRQFGLSEFTRAQIGKEVKISKAHLDAIVGHEATPQSMPQPAPRRRRGGAA
jgi:excisionase family DNA binding protein